MADAARASLEPIRRAEDFWFSNDLFVLHAENTIWPLAAFQQSEMEMVDGSPVVRLHDAAAHVEVFLRAIFDSSYFMPPPTKVELQEVLGILRLAHKYDVNYLFRRALQHLSTAYHRIWALKH
ncbi:hypothetical protein DFH06DRAFT_1337791 [Mycena polygramma]|nr:hypothetical protein DFH06DRAFT_1337791 [Mycena polygramma]